MNLIMIGVSYHKTPLEIRQKFYLDESTIILGLKEFKERFPSADLVIISTCNRIELYAQQITQELLIDYWTKICKEDSALLHDHLYTYKNSELISHLYKVACGLDSMIVGEHQILGQLKMGYSLSQQVIGVSNPLNRLFEHCFFTAKAIRVGLIQSFMMPSLEQRVAHMMQLHASANILCIGAGQTIQLVLKKIAPLSKNSITLCNRTDSKAQQLATLHQVSWQPYTHLNELIAQHDTIIIATASAHPLLRPSQFSSDTHWVIIDLSVPSNTCRSLSDFKNIKLISIDDLQDTHQDQSTRKSDLIKKAAAHIKGAVDHFNAWLQNYERRDRIKHYRALMKTAQQELELRALSRLNQGADPKAVLQEFSHKLTQKLLHQPSIILKKELERP